MMTLREMSDRLEIQQNLWDYSTAVDLHDWDLFRRVFVPGVTGLYGRTGDTIEQSIAWLDEGLSNPPNIGYHHIMGNLWINVAGDDAESIVHCFNPMSYLQESGDVSLHVQWLWYHWRHVRTPEGWRIAGLWQGPSALGVDPPMRRASGWTTPPAPVDSRRLLPDVPPSQTPRYGV